MGNFQTGEKGTMHQYSFPASAAPNIPARSEARNRMLLLALFVACVVLVVFDLIAWRWGVDSRPSRESRAARDWEWLGTAPAETGTTHDD
jgi:hypothetical protein